jgi:hypothetical protein
MEANAETPEAKANLTERAFLKFCERTPRATT